MEEKLCIEPGSPVIFFLKIIEGGGVEFTKISSVDDFMRDLRHDRQVVSRDKSGPLVTSERMREIEPLVILQRLEGEGWELTDKGSTLMLISYRGPLVKKELMEVIKSYNVSIRDGELYMPLSITIDGDEESFAAQDLYSFYECLLVTSDLV